MNPVFVHTRDADKFCHLPLRERASSIRAADGARVRGLPPAGGHKLCSGVGHYAAPRQAKTLFALPRETPHPYPSPARGEGRFFLLPFGVL
jgi:hypothetical protein